MGTFYKQLLYHTPNARRIVNPNYILKLGYFFLSASLIQILVFTTIQQSHDQLIQYNNCKKNHDTICCVLMFCARLMMNRIRPDS